MAAESEEVRPFSIDVAIERAVVDLARAVELELAEAAQNIDLLNEEHRARIARLGEQLIRISRGIDYLLGVTPASGTEPVTSTPVARIVAPAEPVSEKPPTPMPLPPRPPASFPPAPEAEATTDGASAAEEEEEDKDDLYAGIVDLERIPQMPLKEGAPSVTVSVLNGNRLGVGQRTIALEGHELYLFNALMLLRDTARAAEELRGFNFAPNASNGTAQIAFNKAMNNLSAQLNGAAGLEVIKRVGQARGTRYAVNPNLVLEDLRTDEEDSALVGADVKKK